MVLPDGTPKGMKMVLQERGVDVKGMSADRMREMLSKFPDFKSQMTILEEVYSSQQRTHFPKISLRTKSNRMQLVSR